MLMNDANQLIPFKIIKREKNGTISWINLTHRYTKCLNEQKKCFPYVFIALKLS